MKNEQQISFSEKTLSYRSRRTMHRKNVHHHTPRLLIFRNICLCVRVVLVRFHNHCCFVYMFCPSVSAMRTYCRHRCVAAIRSCCKRARVCILQQSANPLHCILGKSCTHILGSFRQARLLGPLRTCFRVYDGKARGI